MFKNSGFTLSTLKQLKFLLFTHFYCLAICNACSVNLFKSKQSKSLYCFTMKWPQQPFASSVVIFIEVLSLWAWNQWLLVAVGEWSFYRVHWRIVVVVSRERSHVQIWPPFSEKKTMHMANKTSYFVIFGSRNL